MKKQTILLALAISLACCWSSRATITSASWYSANYNTLACTNVSAFADSTLAMHAVQFPGTSQMVASVNTDTTLDPILTLSSAVNNDTGFAWQSYQVNVVMSVPFTFTAPGPSVNNPPTSDWFIASISNPTFQSSGPWANYYEGTYIYSEGTPVGIGGELDFKYSVNFASSTHYIITQEMIPSASPVPEPGTLALLAIGGLGLAAHLRRNSRRSA